MRTKIFLTACIFNLFAANLTYGRWPTIDPQAETSYSISPYVYCSGNPVNRIDPTGMKDTTFVTGQDKPISEQQGTATPLYTYDSNGNPVALHPNAKDAYNCHSYAWENAQGDPTDPRNANLVQHGATKWDNNPDNNMEGYTQLDFNDPNQRGDRVIYYVDANGNGRYDPGEKIEHSAIVQKVDKSGNTTTVIGKMGQAGISANHPTAPDYYNTDIAGNSTSRAYFRSANPSPAPSPILNKNIERYVIPRNATYVALPVIFPSIRR